MRRTVKRTLTTEKPIEFVHAEFDDMKDLGMYYKNHKYSDGMPLDTEWAGGTASEYIKRSSIGNEKYAAEAERLGVDFDNVSIADYAPTSEWNTQIGALDYSTAMAGDPMCFYGSTVDITDRSPVTIYVDLFVSGNINVTEITRRGLAILSLVQSLSVFRPVLAVAMAGCHHRPTNTNVLYRVPVPTAPLDVAMAGWMLADPTVTRIGILKTVAEVVRSNAYCSIPPFNQDFKWSSTQLGAELAAQDGVDDHIFVPMLTRVVGTWSTEKSATDWVREHLEKFT